jgi:ubiquinone/menaquinone biosynthesis C-methylase UbiE
MKELASNREWKKWGEMDPLFAVAAWKGKNRGSSDAWTDEAFYRLGELDWKDFAEHWERFGVQKDSCLEIGCGAGRITRHLASYFKEVHAIDVSEKMIAYAKLHTSPSVVFQLSNGTQIPVATGSVSSVFSAHVFQHLGSLSIVDNYFAEVARIMKPHGSLMIHVPISRWPLSSRILNVAHLALKSIERVKTSGRRILMEYGLRRPIMPLLSCPIEYFFDTMPRHGFGNVELAVFPTKSNNDPHPFVFAHRI